MPTGDGKVKRLDPRSFIVRALNMLGRLGIPIAIGLFTVFDKGKMQGLVYFAPLVLAVIGFNLAVAYLGWRKFTYLVGANDIRVESGIVSRAARSVPYERIQDVSLEQKLLPRLFGLVEVKFETGSGAGEDLKLAYLAETEGERLRELVRERREDDALLAAPADTKDEGEAPLAPTEASTVLFAMSPQRLLKYGLFEFSLAIVAVVFGLTQQFDFLLPFDIWDFEAWQGQLAGPGAWLASLGFAVQVMGGILAALFLLVAGFGTGIIRTFTREWGFLLEKTARGFRRRRGMFTRTDVVMPLHRVQAVEIGTRFLRYRFGWHGLKFVSLAQDAGSSSHVVAPFAQMEEIDPIIRAAGFELPGEQLEWQRASTRYRTDSIVLSASFFLLVALVVAIVAPVPFALIPLALAAFSTAADLYAWSFRRHALSQAQLFSTRGLLAPTTQIANRVKLQSVEIVQGPIAQRRGYATLHLGLAGGSFSISGIPLERARQLREAALASIAQTDFSKLD